MSDIRTSALRLRVDAKPTSKIVKSDRTRAAILYAAPAFIWSRPFHEITLSSLKASTSGSRRTLLGCYANESMETKPTFCVILLMLEYCYTGKSGEYRSVYAESG